MSEPTPTPDSIPDVVLDELRTAFSGSAPAGGGGAGGASASARSAAGTNGSSATVVDLTPAGETGSAPIDASAGTPSRSTTPRKRAKADARAAKAKERELHASVRRRERAARRTSKKRRKGGGELDVDAGAPPAPPAPPKLSRKERRAAERAKAAGVVADDGVESVRVVPVERSAAPGSDRLAAAAAAELLSSVPSEAGRTAPEDAASPPSGPAVARSTIVIGGDDLPDARYLDEEAEPRIKELYGGDTGAGSGAIVLGDELDSSGAFDAVTPPPRSMDPRVRARRIAVKRAAGRKRLLWAAAFVVVALIAVAALAILSSSLFAVRAGDVEVTGAVYTDPAALQAVIDDVVGEPVLLVDTQALERRLEELPWVERAAVTTDFPHSLDIDLRERLPLATFQGSDGGFRVIDREGRVLAVLDNQPVDYMLLTGAAPDVAAGDSAGEVYADAAQLVSALPTEIRRITESVSVDATTADLGLQLQPDVPVRLGDFQEIETKLARLLQYMRGDDGISRCSSIDVSTGEVSCAT